ncbi:hypothetical protein C8R46DRAFT_1213580 [Mycena filopes]|nr:hypothetical protein C8R46DRAFT_1213580 [Mycena filopes]
MPQTWDRSQFIPSSHETWRPPRRRLLHGLQEAAVYYPRRLWVPSTVQSCGDLAEVLLFGDVLSKTSEGNLMLTVPTFEPSWELDLATRLFAHQTSVLQSLLSGASPVREGHIPVEVQHELDTTFLESGEQVVLRVAISSARITFSEMLYWAFY